MKMPRPILGVSLVAGLLFSTPVAPSGEARAQTEVLGTIRATVDGEARTWYVVRGTVADRPYASGFWYAVGEDENLVALSGFDTDDPPLDTFEFDSQIGQFTNGEYGGSAIALSLSLDPVAGSATLDLADGGVGNSVSFMPVVSIDYTQAYISGAGSLEVTEVSLENGTYALKGVFSATLERLGGGETVEVTNGSFEARGIPSMQSLGLGIE